MKYFGIFAADCDAYFFKGAPEQHFCSGCGSCIGKDKYYPEKLDIRKLKNFATTYDNRLLLSNVAREFLIEKSRTQLTFKLVNKKPDIYVMETSEIVAFDVEKRGTRFVDYCDICGNYESVVGATPIMLKGTSQIESCSVVKTDISFGSSKEKAPIYIVGEELAKELKNTFKEIDLLPVVS